MCGEVGGSAEFFGIAEERRVAVEGDLIDDGGDGFFYLGIGCGGAAEGSDFFFKIWLVVSVDAHGGDYARRGRRCQEILRWVFRADG